MAFTVHAPHGQKTFVGLYADDTTATNEVKALKWDTAKNGSGNPEKAMVYYDTTTNQLKMWTGSAWDAFANVSGAYLKADGSVALTSNWGVGSFKITGLANGATGTQDAATVAQMEAAILAAIQGDIWDEQVDALANIATLPAYTRLVDVITADANGAFPTQDAVPSVLNQRYLVTKIDGSAHIDAGIYKLTTLGVDDPGGAPWVLTREAELSNGKHASGHVVPIDRGTTYGEHQWRCFTTKGSDVVNTDALTFKDWGISVDHNTLLNLTVGDPHTQYVLETALASTTGGSEGAALVGTDSKANLGASTTVEAALTFLDGQDPTKYSTNAGNPNGIVAGATGDHCLDTTNNVWYYNNGGANNTWFVL